MRGAKSAKWVAIAAVVALGATACGGGGDDGSSGGDRSNGVVSTGVFSYQISEPQHAWSSLPTPWRPGRPIINALFSGLVRLDTATDRQRLAHLVVESVKQDEPVTRRSR